MEKRIALQRWHSLEENQPILPHFTPIAADAHGSTFGACGIRISGNPQFIDAVLSRLKDLLQAESGATRLTLSRQSVKPVSIRNGEAETVKQWANADTDAETCYIQIRERTARTRQRKARESTAPLFASEEDSTPTQPNLTATAKPTQEDAEEDAERKHAHFGGDNGEVLWD